MYHTDGDPVGKSHMIHRKTSNDSVGMTEDTVVIRGDSAALAKDTGVIRGLPVMVTNEKQRKT